MNRFIIEPRDLPPFFMYPRALLGMGLTATETSVYLLLLDRARISARSDDWRNYLGQVYVYYPIRALTFAASSSETAVKKALRGLEQKDMIRRQRQGMGKPNRIYVKLPEPDEDWRPA